MNFNYLFFFKIKNMFIKIFVQNRISGLLLCSCSNKDFSKESGKYFIHSLKVCNIIQNRILNVQEKQPFIEYNIN